MIRVMMRIVIQTTGREGIGTHGLVVDPERKIGGEPGVASRNKPEQPGPSPHRIHRWAEM